MPFPPPELRTARLLMRRPRMADAPELFARYAHDPEVTRYLLWRPHASVRDTESFITLLDNNWQKQQGHLAYVIDGDDGPIGMLGFDLDGHGVLVGYVIAKNYWGRGFGTEAMRAICDAALAEPHIHRVWAYCDTDNIASARLLEKAGLTREGKLRKFSVQPNIGPEPRDVWVFARVK